MIELYSTRNEIEWALLKSIFDAEAINYFVRNDNFGTLKTGTQIELYNKKMILVQDDQSDSAKELLTDYLYKTEIKADILKPGYSFFDKIRMCIEVLLFSWIIPGRKKQ